MPGSPELDGIEICKQQEVTIWKSDISGEIYPVEKAAKAYQLFMLYGKSPTEISAEIGIPTIVIEEWSRRYNWSLRKLRLAEESVRALDAEVRRTQAAHRIQTVTSHLESARSVVAKAREFAEQAVTPRALKDSTDALTAAATMEARAVGLAEKTVEKSTQDETGEGGKPAMVFIGLGALPPPKVEKQAIDVQSEDKGPGI